MTVPTVRTAWAEALYGPAGFYRRESPGSHFRTSVHTSPAFAHALLRYADAHGLETVVDLGAGRGELLARLHDARSDLRLVGVEIAERPEELCSDIEWRHTLPDAFDGLLVANEWLDNIPCDVVEADDEGLARMVHLDPATGAQSSGVRVDDPWLTRWWPIGGPGERAEIGATRDEAWEQAVGHLRSGVAIAIDYGHRATDRPVFGSLRSYAEGREVEVRFDGSRDVTAHVAVDAVAERVGGTLRRQRDVLGELGVDASRPPIPLATSDPAAYVRALSAASEAAELTATGGLGDFWWIVTER